MSRDLLRADHAIHPCLHCILCQMWVSLSRWWGWAGQSLGRTVIVSLCCEMWASTHLPTYLVSPCHLSPLFIIQIYCLRYHERMGGRWWCVCCPAEMIVVRICGVSVIQLVVSGHSGTCSVMVLMIVNINKHHHHRAQFCNVQLLIQLLRKIIAFEGLLLLYTNILSDKIL